MGAQKPHRAVAASRGQRHPVSRIQSLTERAQAEDASISSSGGCVLSPWLQLTGAVSNTSPPQANLLRLSEEELLTGSLFA